MILVIDNYDSFTWNLVDLLRREYGEVQVNRKDEITVAEVEAMNPKGILISPGPGRPEDAGVSVEGLRQWAGQFPVLGVCLGHQLIGTLFGARLVNSDPPTHGKTALIHHEGKG